MPSTRLRPGCLRCRDVPAPQLAQRCPQSATSACVGVDTKAIPDAGTDSELQLRVGFGCVVGAGFEQLVRERELEDGPERLHVLMPKRSGRVRQVVLVTEGCDAFGYFGVPVAG